MQKVNFTSSLNRRNKQITLDLANVFYNGKMGCKEGSQMGKETMISKPKVVNDDEDDSLSKDSDSIIRAVMEEKRMISLPVDRRNKSTKIIKIAKRRGSLKISTLEDPKDIEVGPHRYLSKNTSKEILERHSPKSELPHLRRTDKAKKECNSALAIGYGKESYLDVPNLSNYPYVKKSYGYSGNSQERSRMLPKLKNIDHQWSSGNTKTTSNEISEQGRYKTFKSLNNFALKPAKSVRKSMDAPNSEYMTHEPFYTRSGENTSTNVHSKSNRFGHPRMMRPRVKKSSQRLSINMIKD